MYFPSTSSLTEKEILFKENALLTKSKILFPQSVDVYYNKKYAKH